MAYFDFVNPNPWDVAAKNISEGVISGLDARQKRKQEEAAKAKDLAEQKRQEAESKIKSVEFSVKYGGDPDTLEHGLKLLNKRMTGPLALEDQQAVDAANKVIQLEQKREKIRDIQSYAEDRKLIDDINAIERSGYRPLTDSEKSLRNSAEARLGEKYKGLSQNEYTPSTISAQKPGASNTIKVRKKSTGQTGTIKESDFNPALYERL